MVVVALDHGELTALLGKEVPLEELERAIPMLGAGHEGVEDGVLRMEFDPNRPDLYSVEGVARALRAFLGLRPGPPSYEVGVSGLDLLADPAVEAVRPHVVGGVVRGVRLTDALVASVVELQERLHTGPGRQRRKVAIGLHDLDRVEPPFRYTALGRDEVRFVPLGSEAEMSLGEVLRDHEKGREYGWILDGAERVPVILDAQDEVLSFPPIINGRRTELSPQTENLFVDVTGMDVVAVRGALNILVTALAERGGRLESVTVITPEEAFDTPDLAPLPREVSLRGANALLGLDLRPKEAVACLERMGLAARARGDVLAVEIPAYRMDILHDVDVVEDLAIGYGIERFPSVLPRALTVGAPAPLNEFTEVLRQVLVGHGLQEVRTLTFQDPELPYRPREPPLSVANPVTADLRTVRSSLLPSVLDILRLNRRRELPQRIFEIDDVVLGGRNRRHAAGALVHARAGFTEVKGLVLGVFRDLGLPVDVEEEEDPNLLAGRCARPVVDGRSLGFFGELLPEVIVAYELTNPVVAFELDVQGILERLASH